MTRPTHYKKGDKIGGRYLVHQALRGGMGEVYLCLDTQDMTPLALKTFIGTSPNLKDEFFKEVAKWVALERHPNIVRCHWMDMIDNRPFAAMDWIASDESRGTDLRSWIGRGKIDLQQALLFTVDIVRGLIHAGKKVPNMVHRDLKPENILVNQAKQAKVNDFGLALVAQRAELAAESDATDLTGRGSLRVGAVVGTPLYMAPEQWRGEEHLDARTDMYAVGCILYELLTGEFAFKPPSSISTQSAFLRAMADLHSNAPLPTLPAHFPPRLNEVLAGCLGKTYAERFGDLTALFAVLERVYQTTFDDSLPTVTTEDFTAINYINRGVTLSHLEQPQRAIDDFDRAIRLDPNFAPAYYNRGLIYAALGQYQRAMDDLDRALRLDPNFALAYNNRGRSYSELGQHQRAIDDFNEALRLDPNLALAYNNRGLSYSDLGQHQRAIDDYDHAIHLDPNFTNAYYNRGICYGDLGQPQRAIDDYNRAIALDPNFTNAYYNRGLSYGDLGQHQRAMDDYNEALQLDPNFASAYNNRGLSYAALGQPQRAIDDYDRAIQLDPNFAPAYSNRGNRYADLGQHQQAIDDYDRAITLHPNLAQAYNNRGLSYAHLGQHQRAMDDYNEAIRLDPNLKDAYYNRGNSYAKLGQPQRAIDDYDHAIHLDPNDKEAYFNKGAVLANTGHLQESLPLFEKAHSLAHPQATGAIQQIHQRLGMAPTQPQPNEQEQLLRQIVSIYQQHGEAGLQTFLSQQGVPAPQIAQLIAQLKQVLGKN